MATTLTFVLSAWLVTGCGDQCERLCRDASVQLEQCGVTSWALLGARSRNDFVVRCRAEWDRRSADLTSSNLNEALEVCGAGRDELEETSCDTLLTLYGFE